MFIEFLLQQFVLLKTSPAPKFNCSLFSFSYPTQRVAEGIMFLTRPSVSLSVSQSVSSVFLVSTTRLKPLNRISWNFVVMKDIMCRCAYSLEIFPQSYALFELRNLAKMKDTTETVYQCNSSKTAQKNFVKLCNCEGNTM